MAVLTKLGAPDCCTFCDVPMPADGDCEQIKMAFCMLLHERMAGVHSYEDLNAYQLSRELGDQIFSLTEAGPALKNVGFRDQIRRASSSPPANIAEGFGRFKPREFAHFLRIARASLLETRNHIEDGRTKKYFNEQDCARLMDLQVRATKATTGLLRYLDSCRGKTPTGWNAEP